MPVEVTFTPTVRIDCGDALALLRREADESVDCVVTSPPYWGLRDYGNPPVVWGGDPGCPHAWGPPGSERNDLPAAGDIHAPGAGPRRVNGSAVTDGGAFCSRGGTWRGSLGMEPEPDLYVAHLVEVLSEARRVLRRDGTMWLNLGDSFAGGRSGSRDPEKWPKQARNDHMPVMAKRAAGLKAKDLVGIPWRVAFALQAAGWYLRSDICWAKPNSMPESVRDRPARAHEFVFLLTRSDRYHYDADAIAEPAVDGDPTRPRGSAASLRRGQVCPHGGRRAAFDRRGEVGPQRLTRNCRDVWWIPTRPIAGAHFATMPEALVERCILAGCPEGGTVLDPFVGSGTVCAVAARLGVRAHGAQARLGECATPAGPRQCHAMTGRRPVPGVLAAVEGHPRLRLYLAGPAGSGKTTVARLLEERHRFLRVALGDFPRAIAVSRGLAPERVTLQALGDEFRARDGQDALARLALGRLDELGHGGPGRVVVDGVRLPEEAQTLRAAGFLGVSVRAADDVRARLLARRGEALPAAATEHRTEVEAPAVPADLVIQNDGDPEHLASAVRDLVAVAVRARGRPGPG